MLDFDNSLWNGVPCIDKLEEAYKELTGLFAEYKIVTGSTLEITFKHYTNGNHLVFILSDVYYLELRNWFGIRLPYYYKLTSRVNGKEFVFYELK